MSKTLDTFLKKGLLRMQQPLFSLHFLHRHQSPSQGNLSGSGDFDDFVVLQDLQQGVDVVLSAGEPEHQGLFLHVHHFGMEQFCQIGQFFPHLGGGGADLDHGQFVADEGRFIEVDDLDDVDELGQLADGLLQILYRLRC